MTMYDELHPEEFAETALAVITEVKELDLKETAQVLGEAGLFAVCLPEVDGGLGLPLKFAVPVTQMAGKLSLRYPLVEQMLVAKALAGTPEAAALSSGSRTVTIAWQAQEGLRNAGHAAYVDACDWVLVSNGEGAVVVERSSVELVANTALDPESPQYSVQLANAKVIANLSEEAFQELRNDALVLTGAYLNGAAQGALEYTADYLANRVQFGRPLSAKQAVRHHLARMRLLNEVSISAIKRALEENEFATKRAIAPAWSGALQNAIFIIEKAIHLNGGMGFTWEVPLHYALRDVRRIEAAFDGPMMVRSLGAQFINAA